MEVQAQGEGGRADCGDTIGAGPVQGVRAERGSGGGASAFLMITPGNG